MAKTDKVKLAIFAAMAVVFLAFSVAVANKTTSAFDSAMLNLVYSLRTPLLTGIMFGATFFGSTPFIGTLATIIVLALWIKNFKQKSVLLALALLASVAINNALKYSIHRLRPDILPLENASFYSFPSGHAMNSLVFYGILIYWAHCWLKNKSLLIAIDGAAIILVAAIGFSRIYLGDHYPTDVIAGFVAGACVLLAAIAIDNKSCYNMSVNKK